jgi:predicted O-methyltransferase YrrM
MEYPNWFESTEAVDNFKNMLYHYKGQPNLKFLQLGVYTGDASVWLLENILTDETSKLIDIDTWQGSDEEAHKDMDFEEIYKFYLSRVEPYGDRVESIRATTMDFLRYEALEEYDFIYIDADHTATGVLLDAELSWDILKQGGIMAFDDYEWKSGKGNNYDPAPGINSFLNRHNKEFRVLHQGWQVWIIKG